MVSNFILFSRTLFLAVLIFMVSVAGYDIASAHGGGPVYEKRHVFMNELGDIMKAFGNFLKRNEGSLADMREKALRLIELTPKLTSHFPPDTGMKNNHESHARPEIWELWNEFVDAVNGLEEQGIVVKVAFESGDKSEIRAAVKALGEKGCRGCHNQFREKD